MKFIVQFSGGKDSLATLLYARENYSKELIVVFCDTGWESNITYEHIKDIESQLNISIRILKSKKYNNFIDLCIKKKRAPSTKARFCTQELKINPMVDYILDEVKDNAILFQGIRKDESISRAKMPKECQYFQMIIDNSKFLYRRKEVIEYNKIYSTDVQRPIFYWTAEEVFAYIHSNGLNANPLYYQGFSRVGCYPCIMCRHKEIKLIAEKHPEEINKIREIELKTERSFFTIDYIPSRFCKNKKFPMIDDVINYVQDDPDQLKIFNEKPKSCTSIYNICE